jgi:hypothetical protein
MIGNRSKILIGDRIQAILLIAAALLFFVMFSFWSGVPTGEQALPFWIGTGIMVTVLIVFGVTTWHLLFRALPAGQSAEVQPIRASTRQAMALLLGTGGFSIVVGTFWDEVWHRQYGIPFGEDFFWRPHLLMYFGFLAAMVLAAWGITQLLRGGMAGLQQRFRANPVITLLILVGAFLMYVLPADPLWHEIYGEDLTAWSMPHLLVVASFILILLLAVAIHLSTQPRREWGTPAQLRLPDLLPLLMFATISLQWNQFFMVEWDSEALFVLARPEWLLPVLIVGGAALIGVMANHTLRVFGAAILTGLLALSLRYGLIQLFDVGHMIFVNAWLLALPSMLLIDLWYMFRRGDWIGAGAAGAVGMGLVLLTVFDQYYRLFTISNFPVALIMVLAGSVAMSWLGAAAGDYFAEGNKQGVESTVNPRLSLALIGVIAATAAFVIFFVTTAKPPA